MKIGFVFPGQGSQAVGMGQAWAQRFEAARRIFEEADEVLGRPLSELCWRGPEETLQLTANTQPAMLTTSAAIYRVVSGHCSQPVVMAGHSLGEYSALVAAGVLSFAEALRLVRDRGELMQKAVPVGDGAMAAIMGLEAGEVARLAADAAGDDVCTVASFNAPVQTVIAGHAAAVERAVAVAKKRGARRALMLPVSAPFHSPLMRPVRDGLAPRLDAVRFDDPEVPVVCNVDARPVTTGDAAREALKRQVADPVRWVESVRWMVEKESVERFLEIGPGKVLTDLIRRIVPGVEARSVSEPDALDRLLDLEGVSS